MSNQDKLKILLVGSGGREHALAWKLSQSSRVEKILCAPGNAGIAAMAQCIPLRVDDTPALVKLAKKEAVDLVVVGPEMPLTLGLVDALEFEGIRAFGPTAQAAELEGSKVFAKELMCRNDIPTAKYGIFTDAEAARTFAREMQGPWVVKADGLAAGKGVLICTTLAQTEAAIDEMLVAKTFGAAGNKLVLEEFLEGEELSLMAFSDGKTVIPMVSAQDHKRVYSGDKGPNTGGMGAYSPAPVAVPDLVTEVRKRVLEPAVQAMAKEGRPFKGVLYAGLMITKNGPMVLEFNARFGDPETQVVLPRLKTDLVDILLAVCDGKLDQIEPEWSQDSCVSVVMASGGYPGDYKTGYPISGLTDVPDDILVFHGGTKSEGQKIVTAGGRVLAVTALGGDLRRAVDKAYQGVGLIGFAGAHFRDDIAHRAFKI